MKTMNLTWPVNRPLLAFCLLLTLASRSHAQTTISNPIPAVTIRATDNIATWAGDTGTFTVFRSGNPAPALNVYYCISGTASNGVDYQAIGNLVQIPSGVLSNSIVIKPINLGQTDITTVTLDISCPSPLMIPVNYAIGSPSHATVFITPPGVSNIPPSVAIVSPTNGAVFHTPVNIPLLARIADPDGVVTNVEFFAGSNDLGRGLPVVLDPPGVNGVVGLVYFLNWLNVPTNSYSLTAVALDNGGASTTSGPIKITVLPGPPPTNLPPVVQLASPTNGATFFAPGNIHLIALANDSDGYVATVEFLAGTNSLGIRTNNPMSASPINPFMLTWSNVAPGSYVLTAKATDNGAASTVSDPVNVSVMPGPPPTNLPPVVRIISPPNGDVFRAPVNIPLFAYAADFDGFVASVEFFADGGSLGFGHRITISPTAVPGPTITPTNFFTLVWSNAPVGTNIVLTAKATDNGGAPTVSTPVKISVLPSLTPPTNRPPVLSIVATDPVAIEGTNCWRWVGLTNPVPTWSSWLGPSPISRFFTNCGPKNATFTVLRLGATNDDIDVSYNIGGSATNGVDYVVLPGSLTIPAGQRRAAITIVPLDDGPPDINSTVVLKLTPGTNYVLGFPRTAAAIILDSRWPQPLTCMMPGNVFNLNSSGPDGAWFHVDYSTDLLNWTPICTNQVVNGSIDFVDPDAQNASSRFYRTVPEAGPPQ